MLLNSNDLKPFESKYLAGGWKQDDLELIEVNISKNQIQGLLKVKSYFMPQDGIFHLTVPLTFIWVAQLAIFFACYQHNLKKKSGEVYLREIHIVCKKPIHSTDKIVIDLELVNKRYYGASVFYLGNIKVNEGAFTGSGKFVFPLPKGTDRVISISKEGWKNEQY